MKVKFRDGGSCCLVRDVEVSCCLVTAIVGLGFALHTVYFQT